MLRHIQADRDASYRAIVALVEGWTRLTNDDKDAWPIRASTMMILDPHLTVIRAAFAYAGKWCP
jgi:hypothetical protein